MYFKAWLHYGINALARTQTIFEHECTLRMMVYHSTLDYHVTNLNVRFLDGFDGQLKTLTLYSGLDRSKTLTLTKTLTRNLTYFLRIMQDRLAHGCNRLVQG